MGDKECSSPRLCDVCALPPSHSFLVRKFVFRTVLSGQLFWTDAMPNPFLLCPTCAKALSQHDLPRLVDRWRDTATRWGKTEDIDIDEHNVRRFINGLSMNRISTIEELPDA